MKTLREVKIGETVKVVKLHGEGPVKRRIMDMGITRGTEVFVRKVAPLGDPMEVTVRGYELSLRKADTETVSYTHLDQQLFPFHSILLQARRGIRKTFSSLYTAMSGKGNGFFQKITGKTKKDKSFRFPA